MNKNEIINEFERTYRIDGMPNLAGQIIGLFYISNKKLLTFQELLEITKSSKSNLSKTLKQLINLNRIIEVKSEGDKRKKSYQLDIDGLIKFMDYIIANYENQNELLIASKKLRNGDYPEMDKFINKSIAFNNEMLEFLKIKSETYFKVIKK